MTKRANTPKKKAPKVTPHDLVRKHIEDPDHVITDEEMQNLSVGTAAEDYAEVNKEVEEIDEELKHLRDSDLPNPYAVLGE